MNVNIRKYSVILDIDGTLVHTLAKQEALKLEKRYGRAFIDHLIQDYQKVTMTDEHVIFFRPGLQEFLDHLFEKYNVAIWSAGTPEYVNFVTQNIILARPNRRVEFVFNSTHCNESISRGSRGWKNLEVVWDMYEKNCQEQNVICHCLRLFHPRNTILIDNTPSVAADHPENYMFIPTFDVGDMWSHHDRTLSNIRVYLDQIA